MRKHLPMRVVFAAILSITVLLGISGVKAIEPSFWLGSNLFLQKQADTSVLPSSLYGNIDCSTEDASNCPVATNYGMATQNSTVNLNNENISPGKSSFLPVYTYIDNRQHYFPIPNSSTAISYTGGPTYGLYLYFNYNFASSITKSGGPPSLIPAQYKINRPQDGRLVDKGNHLLPADITSMSFSQNGKWMVVTDPNVATLRVNLQTFEVLPFGPGFNYTIGLDPAIKTAITVDGRYAVVASRNFNTFRLYDLDTCAAVPNIFVGPVSCQSRDLNDFMKQQVPGYNYMAQVRFLAQDILALYANYQSSPTSKTARYIIRTSNFASRINYLALGDSYISGEGAFSYFSSTNTDTNRCHVSSLAYPYLIGHDLNYDSYHSVACSGATTYDVIDTSIAHLSQTWPREVRADLDASGQTMSILDSFLPGYINQLDFVKQYQPKTITISVGGNDMGFSDIVKSCAMPSIPNSTCYSTYEDRLELVRLINTTVFKSLTKTYNALKAAGPPDMRIYVIGYPQIAKPGGDCALNVHLNNDELIFSQQLISYLDLVTQQAAAKTGVYYVDTQDSLNGHRLCEAGPGSIAMNGLTAGNDRPTRFGGPLADESYHPNSTGYQLLENTILAATHNLTDPVPAANFNAAPPAEAGLEILNISHSNRTVYTTEFDSSISADLAYRQVPMDVAIDGTQHVLTPSSTLQSELHSTPTGLGKFTTDANGNLSAQVTIPASVPTGYHALHFYGTDITGQSVDIYKDVYVASSVDDLDGDGVADSAQRCIGIAPSDQDIDQDGVDDACDANITLAPSSTPTDNPPDPSSSEKDTSFLTNRSSASSQVVPANVQAADNLSQTSSSAVNPASQTVDNTNIITTADFNDSGNEKPTVLGAKTIAQVPGEKLITEAVADGSFAAEHATIILAGLLAISCLIFVFKR